MADVLRGQERETLRGWIEYAGHPAKGVRGFAVPVEEDERRRSE